MIPKTMKALVAYGKHDYKLETNYPVPECGPDDILIKTEGCGICAGDLKCMHGAERFWGNETEPSWVKPPFIPGHEFLGRIVAVGENVTEYKLGERITADQIVPCGECRFCKSGRYWMCQPHATFGFQAANNGGMAEYVRYPKTAVLHRVPEDMPLEKALLVEPYACSKHCVDRAQITNEDVVVISGAGTLGLGMVTYARMKNPAKLIVLDMMDSRLEKAKVERQSLREAVKAAEVQIASKEKQREENARFLERALASLETSRKEYEQGEVRLARTDEESKSLRLELQQARKLDVQLESALKARVRCAHHAGLVRYRRRQGAGCAWLPPVSLLLPLCY